MKKIALFISLLTVISCGKKTSNARPFKDVSQLKQVDLSDQNFSQTTLNGISNLAFYESGEGSIKVFLHPLNPFAPLKETNQNAMSTSFRFNKYEYLEDDIVELTDISLGYELFVANCGNCNDRDSLSYIRYDIENYYYDLLNNKETIRVKIQNIDDNKYFILLNFGSRTL